ncbi:MAG: PLP-dependent aminotransferase family protein [Atribacterota bacterium]|nr:PLP-dependent aminotransferase family protein [Atribacterota bacterium]MDD4289611.1 PLP-dependent aminotransferase family protein [Atribacterota bacterium]MDI9596226.1 PLP-dependent aminotransferase family protein [Atribacterota bacterium]
MMPFIQSEKLFSKLAEQSKASAIREILKIIQSSDVVSLAGGMPDPITFPVEDLRVICTDILSSNSARALQYSSTEGLLQLREYLLKWLGLDKKGYKTENIMISSGSQQGLDLVSKALVDPGDIVIAELPSYLAALNAFKSYGAEVVGIPMDENGMQMDSLESTLQEITNKEKKIKFIYTISNFQNPAGVTMSLPRRKEILEIASKYNLFILEDNPYDKLRFEGEPLPPIQSFDQEGRVINLGTFSKILCPGLRLAWISGNKEIIEKVVILKQATDLCTPILNQMIGYEYCAKDYIDKNIDSNISVYREKRDVMLESLEKHFPEGAVWNKPAGGFFVFVTLPENIDADEMLYEAIKEKVAYVSGSSFFANGKGKNTMRLSFCYPSIEDIKEGVKRLGKVIEKNLKK